MTNTRTNETLTNEFGKKQHNWQSKKLIPVGNLGYVVAHLLQEKFVVEIKGHKYDISFGQHIETGEIGYGWSSAPSPHLTSSEIIEKGFREGTWFMVEDEA